MAESNSVPDLGEAWRGWLAQSERQWNEFFNQVMGTEEFSQGLGRSLDLFLHFQRTMNEAMGSYFMTMNIPTRTDVLELGEHLLAIENRIASIEVALLAIASSNQSPGPGPDAPKPRRSKQPPAARAQGDMQT